jgi:hypothetical protein
MKCDFCDEEFSHKSYVINKSMGIVDIRFYFCSRKCMIATEVYALLRSISEGRESLPEGKDLLSWVKDNVIKISGCTEEEYKEGFEKFNECCTVLDVMKWKNTSD